MDNIKEHNLNSIKRSMYETLEMSLLVNNNLLENYSDVIAYH